MNIDIANIIQQISIWALPVLFAITVHEAAHGWAALQFGDRTAQMLGRISLNPIRHIDPIGTILVPLAGMVLGGFIVGWAKPVPITASNMKNPKKDMFWVALAGPLANFLMAIAWIGLAKIMVIFFSHSPSLEFFLKMSQAGLQINLILMIFNLLPIPPLDGSRMLSSLLPNRFSILLDRIEPYGMFIIIGLFATGILGTVISPIMQSVAHFIYSLFGIV